MQPGDPAAKTETTASDRLDRHALVMAIWVPSGFVATMLLHFGILHSGSWWIVAGFALLIATFVGHIIVNVVLKTAFTAGETALGGVVFAVALIHLLISWLLFPDWLQPRVFMMLGLGLASLVVTLIVYLLIAFGPRQAFEKFDVIRDNNLRPASRLPHKGGRR